MKFSKIIGLTILTLFLAGPSIQQQGTYTPVMLIELWRHGARTPAYNTMKQDFVDEIGPGNIVGNGMRMHYNLGRRIKSLYNDLLGNLSPKEVKVYATTVQRTIISAYSHMMGLLPPGTGLKTTTTNTEVKLAPFEGITDDNTIGEYALPNGVGPVPIITWSKSVDDYFMKGMEIKCPKADHRKDEIFAENVKNKPDIFESISPTIEKEYPCKTYFGQEKYNLNTTGIFSDIDKCSYFYTGSSLVKNADIYSKMKYVFGVYYINAKYTNTNIRKLYTSKMSQDMIKQFEDKIAGKSKLKFFGLSAHETNVVPYMLGYDLTNEECMLKKLKGEAVTGTCEGSPEFAANFIWELSKKGDEYFVKVLYNGKPITTTCSSLVDNYYCKFSDFKTKMLDAFTLSDADYKATCGEALNPDGTPATWKGWKWVAFIFIGVSIFALIGCIMGMKKRDGGDSLKPDLDGDESYSKL